MNIMKDKILPGYLYAYMDDSFNIVTGHKGMINILKSFEDKGINTDILNDNIFVLSKHDSTEPDDAIRTNTRFIKISELNIKQYEK